MNLGCPIDFIIDLTLLGKTFQQGASDGTNLRGAHLDNQGDLPFVQQVLPMGDEPADLL